MTDKATPEARQAAVALRERITLLREPFDPDEETARDFDAFAQQARDAALEEAAQEMKQLAKREAPKIKAAISDKEFAHAVAIGCCFADAYDAICALKSAKGPMSIGAT